MIVDDEGFSGTRTAQVVGISYRQLDYWARTDLIRPSLVDAKGSGSRRRYSYRDLLELKVIKALLDEVGQEQDETEPASEGDQDELIEDFRDFIENVKPEDFGGG